MEETPPVHILMPAYNAQRFILSALQSVVNQTYPQVQLLILDDGSVDDTAKVVEGFKKENPDSGDRIKLQSMSRNNGVAYARTKLIEWSKKLNSKAYIFWLDADICLFNFSIIYEDMGQVKNAAGLLKDQQGFTKIIENILSLPNQTVDPLEFPDIMKVASLGWVKAYAPTVKFPRPESCSFEDFVYMATLLDSHRITALPKEYKPIAYLRRSTTLCGQRKKTHFTHDIPVQLKKLFDTALQNGKKEGNTLKKAKRAQEFVIRKLAQYGETLKTLLETKSFPDINKDTAVLYEKKADQLKKYMNSVLLRLDKE